MSLFLKIFLWFWLAIGTLVGMFLFVGWTTQNEPFARQFRNFMNEAFAFQAQTAAQIYQNEGVAGLDEYVTRLKSSERVTAVGVMSASGDVISGDDLVSGNRRLFDQARVTDELVFDRTREDTIAARRVSLKDGSTVIVMTNIKRPPTPIVADRSTLLIRIVVLMLTGGLVCYGLARYLTKPIVRLRTATRQLADGDLQARVGEKVGRGRDEIAQLSRDFDEMAERIGNLVMSEKRLTQDISHELRSPLARLGVALEIAKQKAGNETSAPLARIEKESLRLNEMISRLLLLSKLETGAMDVERQPLALGRLVNETAADADFEARAIGKKVVSGEIEEVRLEGSDSLLRSAVENVLRNAVRYTTPEVPVSISMKNESETAVIRIQDGGGGVPENELEKLFRPFYRVAEARDRASGGVGLGLAIAERAVHAHGGAISARNNENGLLVEIRLPLNGARR